MTHVTFQGESIEISGTFPAVGTPAPDFTAVKQDLSEVALSSYKGKRVVLNIFPSVDTPVCALSVITFNAKAAALNNTAVLCLSADLPFAQGRFCAAKGIENVDTASIFRSTFAADYGVQIAEGPLAQLATRAVIILDEEGTVVYSELVPEITQEPDYDAALAACS